MRRAYLEIRRKFTRDNRNLARTVKTSAQLSSYGSPKRVGADSAGLSGTVLILGRLRRERKGEKENGGKINKNTSRPVPPIN